MARSGGQLHLFITACVFSVASAVVASPALFTAQNSGGRVDRAEIAIDQSSGNALAVWSVSEVGDNVFGRLYGAELLRQSDGSYAAGMPFLVSPDSGCNQRPTVVYLARSGKYLIAWDTAYHELKHFLALDPIDDRPYRSSDILLRTYTPARSASGSPGALGRILKLNESAIVVTVMPCIVPLTDARDDVFVAYLGSNEGGRDGRHWKAGMWGARCGIVGGAGSDLVVAKNVQMTSWNLIGVPLSGFFSGGRIYAGGVRMDIDEAGVKGRAGFMVIDPERYKVERFAVTGSLDLRARTPSTRAFGEVVSLADVDSSRTSASPAAVRVLGASNVDFTIRAFNSDFATDSFTKLGTVAAAGSLLDQRFFVTRSGSGTVSKIHILYQTREDAILYRAVSSTTGAPTGPAQRAFDTDGARVDWMGVGVFGCDALVVLAETRAHGVSEVRFERFVVN